MRIRTYRSGDLPLLAQVQHQSAAYDGLRQLSEADLADLLRHSLRRTGYTVFLLTDDDDELNTWGQGESLDGTEGEVIGYTILHLHQDETGYHFRCLGTVLPEARGQGAGHGLMVCALNHARLQALDFVAQARGRGTPIFFEVELPSQDLGAQRLAWDFELELLGEQPQEHLLLYRLKL